MLHAYSKKSQENFSLCTNFEIFQKFSVKIKIFLHILIVPIMYECRKLKKAIGNKILFPVILEQCDCFGRSLLFWYNEIKTSIMKFAHCAASAVKSSDNDAGEVHSRTTCPSQLLRV